MSGHEQARLDGLGERLQRQCSEWGVYWRAPDSHGVILTVEQATELLADAIGVEVEITQPTPAPDVARLVEACQYVSRHCSDGHWFEFHAALEAAEQAQP